MFPQMGTNKTTEGCVGNPSIEMTENALEHYQCKIYSEGILVVGPREVSYQVLQLPIYRVRAQVHFGKLCGVTDEALSGSEACLLLLCFVQILLICLNHLYVLLLPVHLSMNRHFQSCMESNSLNTTRLFIINDSNVDDPNIICKQFKHHLLRCFITENGTTIDALTILTNKHVPAVDFTPININQV